MGGGAKWAAKGLLPGVLMVLVIAGCGGGGTSSTVARHHPRPPRPGLEEDFTGPTALPEPKKLARPCGPEQLVVSHEGGANGLMSSYYARFTVFNLSERACSINGYPKLFALRTGGRPAEGPAADGTAAVEASEGPINIVGRGTATFKASWWANVFPPGKCGPRIVSRYRVVLPGSHLVQTVPYPNFDHCTGPGGGGTLKVGRMEPSPELATRNLAPPPLKEAKPAEHWPRCDPSDLVVWQGIDYPGGAAAGTSYGRLEVTNLSKHACKLSGVPHMVAVDLHGRPVGPPVRRVDSMPTATGDPPIRVALLYGLGGSALFTFSVGEVLNYGAHGCDFEYAAGFDVTLPGASRAQFVPAPVRRCLHPPGGKQMAVGPIE
jgi:hypothetical protein